MNYRVVVAHEAEKILDRLDRPTGQRIRTRFVQLAEDPFDPRLSAPLTERAAKILYVVTVDTRGQVYRRP